MQGNLMFDDPRERAFGGEGNKELNLMEWEQCWLRYRAVDYYKNKLAFRAICYNSEDACVRSAVAELKRGCFAMLGVCTRVYKTALPLEKAHIRLELKSYEACYAAYGREGYEIAVDGESIAIYAYSGVGILYGSFTLLKSISMQKQIEEICGVSRPDQPLRMLNHWDNIDGSIERGYAGNSFFFQKGKVLVNERTRDYARLISSVGINSVVINNVNVTDGAVFLVAPRYFESLAKIAGVFREYGIKLFLSLDFAAPIDIGGLETADPLDNMVRQWWDRKMAEVFSAIPNLGGFIIKADSEGRPGPFSYGRTHADGANMLAKAVKPYDGIIIWRCFVYNCQQDWRDRTTDRARSGYDAFMPLDGMFEDNVALQVKSGPMDFQVREPVSPLLGAMPQTNQILEVQITQEYTGQQKHVCCLLPMWRDILHFETYCRENNASVADVISGKTYGNHICGIAAVANTGNQPNWVGSDLAGANLYGYGRLSWDMNLSAEEIAEEWIRQTYSCNPSVISVISDILMMSWSAYEKYTSPLGIGWMVNPGHHYGPNVDGYEYTRWGTYHRADFEAIGIDRSENGTGYAMQYQQPNAELYNHIDTCPQELLLFFHRVRYDYVLRTGKTVMQHIYDAHFDGVEDVKTMIAKWESIRGLIDEDLHSRTLKMLQGQLEHAILWRDVINTYFYRLTGIEDSHHRLIYT
jgi:alpha-glucuronidase